MWPWGHLAVGYLAYSALSRSRFGTPPRVAAAFIVAIATQAPDLIDKPLAWTFALLPSGRSLAHSLFFTAAIVFTAAVVARRYRRPSLAVAFGLGYVSHLLADAVYPLWTSNFASLAYFVWPLLPMHDAPTKGILWYILSQEWTPYATVQFVLFGLAVGVWVRDGTPGLGLARRLVPRSIQDAK